MASMFVNAYKKKGEKPAKPDDFLLFDPDETVAERMKPQQIMNHLKAMTKMMGGKVAEAGDGDDS